MPELDLDGLGDLPQVAVLREAAPRLWRRPSVRAIWVGGSFASGEADDYSDVDLRIAVPPDGLATWRTPAWCDVFGQDAVGGNFSPFGDDAFLHHLVLADGTIFDFFVQTTQRINHEHAVRVIGCRDEAFARRLASFERTPPVPSSAEPASVRELLVNTWVNAHKHRKVLARGLPMVATVGIHAERMAIVQLLYMLHTGRDLTHRPTIRGLTPVAQSLTDAMGPRLLELISMPLRNQREVIAAIDAQQQELAAVGRALAERLAFEYPEQLERTVRDAWQRFMAV